MHWINCRIALVKLHEFRPNNIENYRTFVYKIILSQIKLQIYLISTKNILQT